MSSHLGARFAAVRSACERHCHVQFRAVAIAIAAASLAGCMPATVPVAGADPADPAARVAAVAYRSSTAPYTSLRPAAPVPWRERNDSVAPHTPDR